MDAINILYSRIFFDWVFICFIRMVYPKKSAALPHQGLRCNLPFITTGQCRTNRSLIVSSSKFVDNSPGTRRFLPDHPPALPDDIGVDHLRDGEA